MAMSCEASHSISETKVAMSQSKAERVQTEKLHKLERLQKMTTVRTKPQTNVEISPDLRNQDNDIAKQVDHNIKTIEDMANTLRTLAVKCEMYENRFRETDYRIQATSEKIDELGARTELCFKEWEDKHKGTSQTMEATRLREIAELQKVVDLREKKLQQSIHNEVHEEANARMTLATDVARLQDYVKEVKIALTDDISKCQAGVQNFQNKNYAEFQEIKEVVSAEKVTRERAFSAANSQNQQRAFEVKALLEARSVELENEQKGAFSQLTALVDRARDEGNREVINLQMMMEVGDKKLSGKVDEVEKMLSVKVTEFVQAVDIAQRNNSLLIQEIEDKRMLEDGKRQGDYDKLKEDLAAEHLKREEDESAIISMLETLWLSISASEQ